ncbi:MAG: hypothetical protein P8L85_08460 [Rubripirellula sp.]|nr:hypothetical protein [Rubripirellula sp.]
MLNRARTDPIVYQTEHNLNVDLSTVPIRLPLAINTNLFSSGGFKAEEMATRNNFAHTSPYTGHPSKLTRTHGYDLDASFTDNANSGESFLGGPSTASESSKTLIVAANTPPPGHRIHLMRIDGNNSKNREIGIGYG